MQHCLIWELMLYKFNLGHNTMEATKNIFCGKGEDAFDRCTVTTWFKKFCLGFKTLNYQARAGRPKTVESKAMLQVVEANPASGILRISGMLGISLSKVVQCLYDLSKST